MLYDHSTLFRTHIFLKKLVKSPEKPSSQIICDNKLIYMSKKHSEIKFDDCNL